MELTFDELSNEYLNFIQIKRKPQSMRSIKSRLNNYILPYFGKIKVNELDYITYLNWQKLINGKGLKYRYKKSLHYTMVAILNFSIKFYDLKDNVASKVGNFVNNDEVSEEFNIWTIEEYKKFSNCIEDIVDKTLFDFLFFTGCRLGEVLALNWNDLNINTISINKTISKEYYNGKRVITLPKTKKSIRNIDIDSKLLNELLDLKKYYKNKYNNFDDNFFIFGGVKAMSPTTIERHKNTYCEIANVKKIRIHDFRHSHISMLVSNNLPVKVISERAGHSSTSITLDIYTHSNLEDKKRVIKTLDLIRLN